MFFLFATGVIFFCTLVYYWSNLQREFSKTYKTQGSLVELAQNKNVDLNYLKLILNIQFILFILHNKIQNFNLFDVASNFEANKFHDNINLIII